LARRDPDGRSRQRCGVCRCQFFGTTHYPVGLKANVNATLKLSRLSINC
jgi:hypothetical protein